jgi:hypothetical protein
LEPDQTCRKVAPEIAMDLSQLPKLGKVAGVPGIALGAVVLLLGASGDRRTA